MSTWMKPLLSGRPTPLAISICPASTVNSPKASSAAGMTRPETSMPEWMGTLVRMDASP